MNSEKLNKVLNLLIQLYGILVVLKKIENVIRSLFG